MPRSRDLHEGQNSITIVPMMVHDATRLVTSAPSLLRSLDTDAIALVVSEERGTVTLVRGGTLVPIVDATDLRRRLFESMESDGATAEEETSDA